MWSSDSAVNGVSNIPMNKWVFIHQEASYLTYIVGKPTGNNAKFSYSIKDDTTGEESEGSLGAAALYFIIYCSPYACCCITACCVAIIFMIVIKKKQAPPRPLMIQPPQQN